jgi:ribosome recycling factor
MADDEEVQLIFMDAEERMGKSVDHFRTEADGIRTGRANPAMLENVRVELYGTTMHLNQVATISSPDARLLVVQPFDKSTLNTLEKELKKADLGLTPASDGSVIRLPVPPMTQQRRQEMVKRLKRMQEDCHIAVRNVRRDVLDEFRTMEKDKAISQDDLHRYQEQVQKLTDRYIAGADEIEARKQAELMEV